jgi:hypothetical protein
MKKIILALTVLLFTSVANAALLTSYPVDGVDCTGNLDSLDGANRRWAIVTNLATQETHLLIYSGASIVLNEGADFWGRNQSITYNGMTAGFFCIATDIEVFAPGTK